MAFMSQERKKTIEAFVKPVLKKYGIKGRLGVDNHYAYVERTLRELKGN